MKRFTVHNLVLVFDTKNSKDKFYAAHDMVDAINKELKDKFPLETPQILTSAMDSVDIEVESNKK